MKRFFIVMLTVFALVAWGSLALAQDALTQTFAAKDGSITFQYPDGWQAQESSSDGLTGVLLVPTSTGSLTIVVYGPANTVFNSSAPIFPAGTEGAVTSTVQINGHDAVRLQLDKGIPVVEYIVTFDSGNQLVVMGGVGATDSVSDMDATIMAIAASAVEGANAGTSSASTIPTDLSSAQPITVANAAQVAQIGNLNPDDGTVLSLAFSPDGTTLVVGAGNNVNLIDVASNTILSTLEGHSDIILSVAYSPDGKMVVTGSQDQTVRVWDVASGESLYTFTVDSGYPRSRAVFSPDGKIIAQANFGPLRMWDATTGEEITTIQATGGDVGVNNVAFSPDGKLLATAGGDAIVQLWDVASGNLVATLNGHISSIETVAFSPDGKILASGADDKLVDLWDVATHDITFDLEGNVSPVSGVSFSPDGSLLASVSRDLRLWDVSTGTVLATLTAFIGSSNAVFSPDGKLLAFANTDGVIELWGTAAAS